ncbi:retrotransposon protein [Cucumis melo var. makuwa]|uniref:Retrotransposon protein n=1 Tax=Cucumis melo var. makuwa TaxID=1194695 RepID=A0A5D3C9K0_CUCMM|nr:retrotransposon protein [Cucumis melo var. makuwa]TYK07914.1 retrotransposon protein [Cucumis melo var. makuwa]
MTTCDDIDNVDEGDSTYTTTITTEDIQCIETTTECMATLSRALMHLWTKEEEGTLVECLVDLVSMRDENPIMRRKSSITGLGATGYFAETFANIRSNELAEYEGFDMSDGNKTFLSMTGSSRSKIKRGSQRKGEIEVIHMTLECTNDQLRMIMEWHARSLVNDNHMPDDEREIFCRVLLRDISR